jgi:hypothetical protein
MTSVLVGNPSKKIHRIDICDNCSIYVLDVVVITQRILCALENAGVMASRTKAHFRQFHFTPRGLGIPMNSLESRYENKEANVKLYCKEFRQSNLLIRFFFGRPGFIKQNFLLSYDYLYTTPRQLDFTGRVYALLPFHSALRVWCLFPHRFLPFFFIEGSFGRRRAP